MKIKTLIPAGALALAMISCQGGSGSADLSEGTQGDSIVYYLGQLRGFDYKRQAQRDTSMNSTQEREAFLKGVRDGLNAAKANDNSYNEGYLMGVQMAMNVETFFEKEGVPVNKAYFAQGLSSIVMSDSTPDMMNVQAEYYRLMNDYNTQKEQKDKTAAAETLSQEAQSHNLPKIGDNLYGEVTEKTDGKKIEDGDEVSLNVVVKTLQGNIIDLPFPPTVKVGDFRTQELISNAAKHLKNGETGQFMTSAHALLGGQAQRFNLKPSDILIIDMTANIIDEGSKAEEKDGKVAVKSEDKKDNIAKPEGVKVNPVVKPMANDKDKKDDRRSNDKKPEAMKTQNVKPVKKAQ